MEVVERGNIHYVNKETQVAKRQLKASVGRSHGKRRHIRVGN